MSRFWKIVQTILPWAVATALLIFLFYRIPPDQVWDALQRGHLVPFILFAITYVLVVASYDTFVLKQVFSKFEGPIRMKEIWPGRCVSYVVSLVNYNAGQAALAAYLKQKKGFSFFKTLGNVFFITATDLYIIITMSFFASFFVDITIEDVPLAGWIQTVSYVAFAALFLHLAFWNRWFSKMIPFKFHFSFADWIRGRHLFSAFHQATLKDYAFIALLRLPLHFVFFSAYWVLARIFDASLSFKDVFANVPLVYLLGALPISPGGLGVTQVATVELLKNKITSPFFLPGSAGAEETLLALSLAWLAGNYGLKALIGLYYFWKDPIQLFGKQKAVKANAPHQEGEWT